MVATWDDPGTITSTYVAFRQIMKRYLFSRSYAFFFCSINLIYWFFWRPKYICCKIIRNSPYLMSTICLTPPRMGYPWVVYYLHKPFTTTLGDTFFGHLYWRFTPSAKINPYHSPPERVVWDCWKWPSCPDMLALEFVLLWYVGGNWTAPFLLVSCTVNRRRRYGKT